MARWIPLDSYAEIARRCGLDETVAQQSRWPVFSLAALLPLTLVSGSIFFYSDRPVGIRTLLSLLPCAAMLAMAACVVLGQAGTWFIYVLLGVGLVAFLGVAMQIVVCLSELFGQRCA
jgi:hypothetical protein